MTYVNVRMVNGDTLNLADLAPGAVALDGCVAGPVMGDEQDRWSFDHHADCHRMITQATCEQVLTATHLGFKWDGRDVWVNDLDGDTILSLYIIHRAVGCELERGTTLVDLVRGVGMMDAHGPAAAVLLSGDEPDLVNAFYQGVIYPTLGRNVQERFNEWDHLIETCFHLIDDLVGGMLEVAEADAEPVEVLQTEKVGNLSLVIAECPGFGGFKSLYLDDYDVVALVTDAADGSRRYTVGKVSDLVRFDLTALLAALNELEPGWGGGSSIGGSPRLEGGVSSRLSPTEVFDLACKIAG